MKRRDILAGLAFAGMGSAAEEHEPQSLYIPKAHLVEDRRFLHDFMDEYSFIDLVTGSPEIRITHIPVLLDRNAGKYGTLYGHISRQNPQSGTFDGQHHAVIVFRGPDAYISPTWYAKPEVVPTWNFAVVHASGRPKPIAEKTSLHYLLARLIRKFEGNESAYHFGKFVRDIQIGPHGGDYWLRDGDRAARGQIQTRPGTQCGRQGTHSAQPTIGEAGPFHTRAHRQFLRARTVIVVYERVQRRSAIGTVGDAQVPRDLCG
jgi:hypothetical protein